MSNIGKRVIAESIGNLILFTVLAIFVGYTDAPAHGWLIFGIAAAATVLLEPLNYWLLNQSSRAQSDRWAELREYQKRPNACAPKVVPLHEQALQAIRLAAAHQHRHHSR